MFWCSAVIVVDAALLLSTEGNSLCTSHDDIWAATLLIFRVSYQQQAVAHWPQNTPHQYSATCLCVSTAAYLSWQQRQLVSQSSCNQKGLWSGITITNMAVNGWQTIKKLLLFFSFGSCALGQGDFFPQMLWKPPYSSILLSAFPAASLGIHLPSRSFFFPCLPLLLFHTRNSYSLILFLSCPCSLKAFCRIECISLSLSYKRDYLVPQTVWSLNKKPLMSLKSDAEIRFSRVTKICLSFLVSHKLCESFCTTLLSRITVCRHRIIES